MYTEVLHHGPVSELVALIGTWRATLKKVVQMAVRRCSMSQQHPADVNQKFVMNSWQVLVLQLGQHVGLKVKPRFAKAVYF